MSNADYLKKFKNRLEVLASHGAFVVEKTVAVGIMKVNPNDSAKLFDHHDTNACLTKTERQAYMLQAEQMSIAIAFLDHADPRRYGDLLVDLENDFTKSKGSYPTTLGRAYEYLNEYKVKNVAQAGKNDGQEHNMAFVQKKDKKKPQEFEPWMKDKKCYNCNEKGHISTVCPNEPASADDNDEEQDAAPRKQKSSGEDKDKKSSTNKGGKQVGFVQKEDEQDDDESESDGSIFCNIVTKSTALVTNNSSATNL